MTFRKRHQEPSESVPTLKKLSRHCGYGTELDTNLRDTFVGGLYNRRIKAKLLSKGNSLTWKAACDEALAMEAAEKDSGHLQGRAVTDTNTTTCTTSGEVHKVSAHKTKCE